MIKSSPATACFTALSDRTQRIGSCDDMLRVMMASKRTLDALKSCRKRPRCGSPVLMAITRRGYQKAEGARHTHVHCLLLSG